MELVNYTPLGAVFIDGALIGSDGTLDVSAKDFRYKPSASETIHCANIYTDAMPKGRLWEAYSVDGTINNALSQSGGSMIATVLAYFEYLRKELNPYTTEDLIIEWEESVGLPDPCTIQVFQSLEERRQQVILRLRKTPIVTPAQIVQMVKILTGYDVLVIPRRLSENHSGELDLNILDFELSSDKFDRFTFDVIVDYDDQSSLDVDIGEVLDGAPFPRIIECIIERLKPANSLAIYTYSSGEYGGNYDNYYNNLLDYNFMLNQSFLS